VHWLIAAPFIVALALVVAGTVSHYQLRGFGVTHHRKKQERGSSRRAKGSTRAP
jgi:hypothetical protein